MDIFNREKKKIEKMIQRLQNHALEFSEYLMKIESIEDFDGFEGIEPLFNYLRNRSSDLFVMPGADLLKFFDSDSENSEERNFIKDKYAKDKLEELDYVLQFTFFLGLYLMTVIECLPLKTQTKVFKALIKNKKARKDIKALVYDFPEINDSNYLPLEDLFTKLVETKKFAGLMLFLLLGVKNKKFTLSVKTHHKLLKSIRKNDFKLFEEVMEQSDERLADGLSKFYADLYPVAIAIESFLSRDISGKEMQEFLLINGYNFFGLTPDSPLSDVLCFYIGVVYVYVEFLRGEFPNEAKGIDYFFEINDLWDFMDLYAEWCYQETRQLIDARKEAQKNKNLFSNPSAEIDDSNKEEGSSSGTNTDTDQSEDDQSPTSGDGKKTRKKDANYHIFVDEKPEVIKMLVEGLVEGYTTEKYGAFPSLVTSKRSSEFYDDIEEMLTFFFTGDRSNFSKKVPYDLIWKAKDFYLYLLMQFIFNKKGFKNADEVINESTDPSESLISETYVKADFRGKNTWKEVEAVFGIKPNSIKNSTPTIGQKNEETEQMMKKLAQFWLDCKNSGKG